jgi:DNA-binding transcriptional LysR family regulator
MQRGNLDDLLAFLAVGKERSFTKAAAKLGMSQSSLSHTIRELEVRLGVRLLTRTTRSVAPTQAGERLLQSIGPRFEEIDAEVSAVRELRDKPAGTIRITATEYAADAILLPKLAKLLPQYPDVRVEIVVDYIEGGHSLQEFLDDFPTVSRDVAVAALEQAKAHLIADAHTA